MKTIKNYFPLIVVIIMIYGTYFTYNSILNYYKPLSGCNIKIYFDFPNEQSGDREQIKAAIGYLREQDAGNFGSLCNNVNEIRKKYCHNRDQLFAPPYIADAQGCYIRGTKIIYLQPNIFGSPTGEKNIPKMAAAIAHLSSLSQAYWNSKTSQ